MREKARLDDSQARVYLTNVDPVRISLHSKSKDVAGIQPLHLLLLLLALGLLRLRRFFHIVVGGRLALLGRVDGWCRAPHTFLPAEMQQRKIQ